MTKKRTMEQNPLSTQDHDLLIEIKTKVVGLTDEVRLMRDDTKEKIKNLDTNKVSNEEYRSFKLELAKEDLRFENEIKELKKQDESLRTDLDKALRYIYMAMGGLAVLQIVLSFWK